MSSAGSSVHELTIPIHSSQCGRAGHRHCALGDLARPRLCRPGPGLPIEPVALLVSPRL